MDVKQDISNNPSLLNVFRLEVETQSLIVQEGLTAIKSQSQSEQALTQTLESMMRAAHSLKGSAQLVELDAAANIAHVMEECFIAALNQKINFKAKQVDMLQRANILIQNISQAGEENLDGWLLEHGQEVETTIQEITRGETLKEAIEERGSSREEHKEETPLPLPPPTPTPTLSSDNTTDEMPQGDSSMLELFRLEVEAQAAILNEGLLSLESQPQSAQALESLMRAAHSVKGAARIVAIDAAVQLAHVMEDCFVAAQKHTVTLEADQVDVLLVGVDKLLTISQLESADLNPWLREHASEIATTREEIAAILTPHAAPIVKAQPEPQDAKTTEITTLRQHEVETTLERKEAPANTSSVLTKTNKSELQSANQSTTAQLAPTTERVVRVSAENLNRIMGLAGESLIEANWLQPFADSLVILRKQQLKLSKIIENLQNVNSKSQATQDSNKYLEAARQKERECREILADRLSELELYARRTASLSDRLYREVIASNMRPFNDGVQGFPRMIRDLARKLGKQVSLEIRGKSTPVDRDILKKLEAPLTHILRNAVDHGFETPSERLAASKPREGTLILEAFHRGGMLSITISDDGKGINPEWLREKILSKKLTTPEMVAQLSDSELMEFLFLPGFSTAKQVTEISGRGVGLDIAKSMAQEVGGNVRATSTVGKGTIFNFQLPLTLSVVRTLLVEISGEPYAFPLARIEQIVIVNKKQIFSAENRQYFTLNNKNIGLVAAHQVLELKEVPSKSDTLSVVVLNEQSDYYGLVVDRFLGEYDLVVRPLDSKLGKVQDISAAALMGDGSPILIVDVSDLMRSIDNLLNNRRLNHFNSDVSDAENTVIEAETCKSILVVDDSITVREMERRLLENKGYQVDVAVDGMEGWHAVGAKHYDLVISDVDMPRMNGIEFVSKIKNDPKLNSIPVIIVSYKDSQEHRLQGLEAGANYYLTKASFHDDTLVNAVIDLIGY